MADPFSSRTYLGDGTNAVFSVPFPYLEKAHVHVFVNGVETTAIQWLSSNSIRLNSTPAAGAKVKIMRQTPKDARAVNFQNGTNFVEADLDKSADQTFYIVQEAYDSLTTLIQQDNTGKWDALGKPISNLADPVDGQDAATKAWVLTVPNTTLASSIAAQTAAEEAQAKAEQAADIAVTSNGLVKVSPTDATGASLSAKLAAGDGLAETLLDPGATESLRLSVALADASCLEFAAGKLGVDQSALANVVRAYTAQQYAAPVVRTGASGSQAVDCDAHQLLSLTATGALAFAAPSNLAVGKTVTIMVYADSAVALTWDAAYKASAFPLPGTATAGKWVVLSFFCHRTGALLLTGVAEEA